MTSCYCGSADTRLYACGYRWETVLDVRAVASGKRRSSLAEYRSAQLNSQGGIA